MPQKKDRVVCITGGGLGIGKCMAKAFAREHDKVYICSRTSKDLEQTALEIKREGFFCEAKEVDISQPDRVKNWIEGVYQQQKRIDCLINAAGIYGPIGPMETNDLQKWEETIRINLLGTFHCIRAVLPIMKKQREGKIINLSGGGVGGSLNPNFSSYIASKAAVVALTEVVAQELKEFNIQVNAISPGAVNTRFLDQILEAGERAGKDFYKRSMKQKEEGGTPPEAAAKLALFLSRDESNFITGKVISAKWDDYKKFVEIQDSLEKTSLCNLRRIDNMKFYEKV